MQPTRKVGRCGAPPPPSSRPYPPADTPFPSGPYRSLPPRSTLVEPTTWYLLRAGELPPTPLFTNALLCPGRLGLNIHLLKINIDLFDSLKSSMEFPSGVGTKSTLINRQKRSPGRHTPRKYRLTSHAILKRCGINPRRLNILRLCRKS